MSTWTEDENPLVKMYNEGYTDKEIADELGRTGKSVNSKIYNLKKDEVIGERGSKEEQEGQEKTGQEKTTYQETDDSIHIVCASRRIRTKADVIDFFDIDTDIWKVDSFEVKTSEGYRKDRSVEWDVENAKVLHGKVRDSGKMLIVPLVHTRTKMVRRVSDDISFEEIDNYFEKKKDFQSKIKVSKGKLGGRILEIVLADLHIGSTDFDVAERCKIVIEDILLETAHLDIEMIYLVPLGDCLHYDTANRTTTKGTPIETGLTPYDMFDEGGDILFWVIDRLAMIAPVEVIGIYGNHDRVLSYALFKGISWYYRNEPGVTVDTAHGMAKYREFGNCLFLCHHGDMNKKRLENLVFNEAREAFGRTKYAEIHGAHNHVIETKDLGNGVIVRYNPRISERSGWEEEKGYSGLHSSLAYAWDKERGIKTIIATNL